MTEQQMIDGIATNLMKSAQKFVDTKNEIQTLKMMIDELAGKIIIEMKKEGKESMRITVGTGNYLFEIKETDDTLRCVKQTKSPVPANQEEI